MDDSYQITIGVPTFNREGVLIDTVSKIIDEVDSSSTEILLADQTPDHQPEVEAQLKLWQAAGHIRVIRLKAPSLTGARNAILRGAKAPIVLFIDDDIIPSPQLIEEHLSCFKDETVAAVTGLVYNCHDYLNPPPMDQPEKNTWLSSDRTDQGEGNSVSGGNHSVRTSVALAIGGFDQGFLGAALSEDMDFAQRLRGAGYTIYYNPAAWIIHLAVPSGGCAVSHERIWPEWTHSASLWLYAFRHGFAQGNFKHIVWLAFRHGPGRKEVFVRPWLWPIAWYGFFKGMLYGWVNRGVVKSR